MITWAYLAGFWDGEGHICITKEYMTRHNRRDRQRVRCGLTQSDTGAWILQDIKKFLEQHKITTSIFRNRESGSIMENCINGKTYHTNGCYRLDVHTKRDNMGRFLKAIYPYLCIKKDKAKEALQYVESQPICNTHLINEEESKITELRAKGMTGTAIAKELNRSVSIVCERIKLSKQAQQSLS